MYNDPSLFPGSDVSGLHFNNTNEKDNDYGIVDFLPKETARSAQMILYSHNHLLATLSNQYDLVSSIALLPTAWSFSIYPPSYFIYAQILLDYHLWKNLINHLLEFPLENTRCFWRIFLAIFPASEDPLYRYCRAECGAGNSHEMMLLFEKNSKMFLQQPLPEDIHPASIDVHFRHLAGILNMTECPSVKLWMIYLDAVEKIAQSSRETEDVTWSRAHTSYLYAKTVIGQAIDSIDFWRRYIDFLEHRIHSSIEQKELIRCAYQESLMSPIAGITDLMDRYLEFESRLLLSSSHTGSKKITLGSDFKSAHQKATMTQAEILSWSLEKFPISWPIPVNYVSMRHYSLEHTNTPQKCFSLPPAHHSIEKLLYARYLQKSYDQSPSSVRQYVMWKRRILLELSNPLELRFTSEQWIDRISYIYTNALENLRFHVDLWLEYAKFFSVHRKYERAISVYERALEVFPTDIALHCVYADVLASIFVSCPENFFPSHLEACISGKANDLQWSKKRAILMFDKYFENAEKALLLCHENTALEKQSQNAYPDKIGAQVSFVYMAYIRWSHYALHNYAKDGILGIFERMRGLFQKFAWFSQTVARTVSYLFYITRDSEFTNIVLSTLGEIFPKKHSFETRTSFFVGRATKQEEDFFHSHKSTSFHDWCFKLQTFIQRENVQPKCAKVREKIAALEQRQMPQEMLFESQPRRILTTHEHVIHKNPAIASIFFDIFSRNKLTNTLNAQSFLENVSTLIQPEVLSQVKKFQSSPKIFMKQGEIPAISIDLPDGPRSVCQEKKCFAEEYSLEWLLQILPTSAGCEGALREFNGKVPCANYVMNLIRSNPV